MCSDFKGSGSRAQSHWSVVQERQKQRRQQEALAYPEKARLHKVVSMLAQVKVGLAAALSWNCLSYPIQPSPWYSNEASTIRV